MRHVHEEPNTPYDLAAQQSVELANQLADADQEADIWDIADGLLAGAIHYWLYSRQPCEDPKCNECLHTAEERMGDLMQMAEEMAENSTYYHTPNDRNVGRA